MSGWIDKIVGGMRWYEWKKTN